MKRRLASLFRWLEDYLNPSRRNLIEALRRADRASVDREMKQLDRVAQLNTELEQLRAEAAPVLPPDLAPDWLPTHQAALKAFLNSPAGLVLMHRGRFIHFEAAKKANADVFHTTHSSGLAEGWGKCIEWVLSLSRTSRAPDDAPTGDLTSETTTAPTGESEMRASMSP